MGKSDWDVWVEILDRSISWVIESVLDIFNFS